MAGLLVMRSDFFRHKHLERSLNIFRKQNSGPEVEFEIGGMRIILRGEETSIRSAQLASGEMVIVAGFVVYGATTGSAAIQRLLGDIANRSLNEQDLGGAFTAFCWDGENARIFTDWLGNSCAYRNTGGTVWSTSFLATTMSCDECTLNQQGSWEYIFLGAPNGEDTVLNEVLRLNPEHFYFPASNTSIQRPTPLPREPIQTIPFEQAVIELADSLDGIFEAIGSEFGDKIDTALSGGYDSRLILAALRNKGISPRVHVYGKDDDDDVQIAKMIARGEGFKLSHVDKSKTEVPATKDEWNRILHRNFLYFDGTPPDGIFNAGDDLATREGRMEDGFLALNGGGGEIYRNFYYLPNKQVPLRTVLTTFYSRIDLNICADTFRLPSYLNRLRDKMVVALGGDAINFGRVDIERLYPLFRCRYWMAHNTSVNNIIGKAFTPFMYLPTVKRALSLPIAYKNHGLVEGALINKLDKRLSSYSSNDRRSFDQTPNFAERVNYNSTLYRPVWLRRLTFPIKNKLMSITNQHTAHQYHQLSSLLEDKWDDVHALVLPQNFKDQEQLQRAATIQYLMNRLSTTTN